MLYDVMLSELKTPHLDRAGLIAPELHQLPRLCTSLFNLTLGIGAAMGDSLNIYFQSYFRQADVNSIKPRFRET